MLFRYTRKNQILDSKHKETLDPGLPYVESRITFLRIQDYLTLDLELPYFRSRITLLWIHDYFTLDSETLVWIQDYLTWDPGLPYFESRTNLALDPGLTLLRIQD